MQIKKRCIICGNEFVADRRTAKYCSKKCHSESKRKRSYELSIEQKIKKQEEKKVNSFAPCMRFDCRYYGGGTTPTCDYILHTGMPRGCRAADCDKYIPGKSKQKPVPIIPFSPEEKAIKSAQYDALNMRLDRYEIQRRHSKERK